MTAEVAVAVSAGTPPRKRGAGASGSVLGTMNAECSAAGSGLSGYKSRSIVRYVADQRRRKRSRACNAMMSACDDAIGSVVDELRAQGMYANTLIIFSSDNGGPQDHANNWPLRGSKGSDFEGGVRVAAFVSGGFVLHGSPTATIPGLMHIADWWATLSAIAGAPPVDTMAAAHPGIPSIDSIDMSAMLSGANATSPRTELVLSSLAPLEGAGAALIMVIDGVKWKLVRGSQGNGAYPSPAMPNR